MKSNDINSGNESVVLSVLLMLHHDDMMLVPNVAIAEIVDAQAAVPAVDNTPWIQGQITWRGEQVPLISLEKIRGKDIPHQKQRKIAILNSFTGSANVPFYAVAIQEIPKMLHVENGDIRPLKVEMRSAFENMKVDTQYGDAIIPHLANIEAELEKHYSV
jgi:chemosensory pili system protein ChpC